MTWLLDAYLFGVVVGVLAGRLLFCRSGKPPSKPPKPAAWPKDDPR